ncbi:hypothetical protein AK830_g5776 [Neonectria ditissima]|uniref:BZIP domain-containing protein n=1 Tax=Neonectria ditissima TaxID=78410 RepID=A0A0P7ASK9_9HYPO|nr:hypothetical protein AK830_g5776 [Neonectria ditissima]
MGIRAGSFRFANISTHLSPNLSVGFNFQPGVRHLAQTPAAPERFHLSTEHCCTEHCCTKFPRSTPHAPHSSLYTRPITPAALSQPDSLSPLKPPNPNQETQSGFYWDAGSTSGQPDANINVNPLSNQAFGSDAVVTSPGWDYPLNPPLEYFDPNPEGVSESNASPIMAPASSSYTRSQSSASPSESAMRTTSCASSKSSFMSPDSSLPDKGQKPANIRPQRQRQRTRRRRQASPPHEQQSLDSTSPDNGQEPIKANPQRQRQRAQRQRRASPRQVFDNDADDDDDEKRNKFLQRNRVAASKCRQKKKEWTNQLEATKTGLETRNLMLRMEIDGLTGEVDRMKHQLMDHATCNDSNIDQWMEHEARRVVEKSALNLNTGMMCDSERTLSQSGPSELPSIDTSYDYMPDSLFGSES